MIDPGEHRSERMRGLELSLESFKYLNWVNFTEPTGKARKENPKRFQETGECMILVPTKEILQEGGSGNHDRC